MEIFWINLLIFLTGGFLGIVISGFLQANHWDDLRMMDFEVKDLLHKCQELYTPEDVVDVRNKSSKILQHMQEEGL